MDALAAGAVSGPMTTTALASALGLATGSVSHHLKVLVDAGLVERASASDTDGRVRRWQLVKRGMRWSPAMFRDRPAGAAASTAAQGTMLARQLEYARAFLAAPEEPWDEAAYSGHVWLHLTPAELEQLGRELDDLLLRWRRREIPDDGAHDRRTVLAFAHTFPSEP